MALSDVEIVALNPWWADPGWRARDPHLKALDAQPTRLEADFVTDVDLGAPGISVLRGPRQVGKSTDLKMLVERALDQGWDRRAVIYIALDLLEDQPVAEFARSVVRAKQLSGGAARTLLLLDEVTSVAKWQSAVKFLWDSGTIREDVVLCTGSSAIDLQQGAAERLPGRRRGGRDHLVLPQSFAGFARATERTLPASPRLTVEEMRTPAGVDLLESARLHLPALDRALGRYLTFGGLPAAVVEAASGASAPSDEVKRTMWDSLVRELQRRGASVPAAQALLARVATALGAETNWSDLARDMDVPLGKRALAGRTSHHTVRSYVELLAASYFLLIGYFWKRGQNTNDLSKNKKLFFVDPLLYTITLDRSPGLVRNDAAAVENAVGLALFRMYEPPDRLAETMVAPERLHIWRTAACGEIDFVAGAASNLDIVEVKYQNNPGFTAAAAAARAHPGRPVVLATKQDLDFRDLYARVPVSLLLWALG